MFERVDKCTRDLSSNAQCVIFAMLDELNAELNRVDLMLEECAPGLLILTTNIRKGPHGLYVDRNPFDWHLIEAIFLHHHCIVSVDIDASYIRQKDTTSLAYMLLAKVPFLERFRVCDLFVTKEKVRSLASALSTAHDLTELQLQNTISLDPTCVRLLQNLFRKTDTLTTLCITRLHVIPSCVPSLFDALLENSSVHTLEISLCTCFSGPEHGEPLIADLVRKGTLKSLALQRCCYKCKDGMQNIMRALAYNRSLLELSLRGFGFLIAFDVLMPALLIDNDGLRSLSIVSTDCDDEGTCNCKSDVPNCRANCLLTYHPSEEYFKLDLLTEGISKNTSLEKLAVDLSTSPLSMCQRFFEVLRGNSVLRKVTVTNVKGTDTVEICQAIRKHYVEEKVAISCPLTGQCSLDAVAFCKCFSSVFLDYADPSDRELLSSALTLLPQWDHIRDMSLLLCSDQLVSGCSDFLHYLKTTTNLRALYLHVEGHVAHKTIRSTLMLALLRNSRLQTLSIVGGIVLGSDEATDVARALCRNDSLCDFALFNTAPPAAALPIRAILLHMAACIRTNYTLCSLEHDAVAHSTAFRAVQDTVGRNRTLAMRAAHFVVGADRSQYCADAFSLVRNSAQLLFDVMKMASVDEAEAATLIEETVT